MMSPGADLLIQLDMFQLFLEKKDELDKKFCVLEIFVSDLLRKFVLLVHSTRVRLNFFGSRLILIAAYKAELVS